MPRIFHTSTVTPKYSLTAAETAAQWANFRQSPEPVGQRQSSASLVQSPPEPEAEPDPAILQAVARFLEAADVAKRNFVLPTEALLRSRGAGDRNREFQAFAVEYGQKVLTQALEEAGLAPVALDGLITVSCTGLMIPSLGAHLVEACGLRDDTVRVPITELGCAGGAAALALACDLVRSRRCKRVAVLALEFPSLTFNVANTTTANLVSSVLFGDGAGVALVDGARGRGLRIIRSRSRLLPGTRHLMGFTLEDGGLQVVLDRDVPRVVKANIGAAVGDFLTAEGLTAAGLQFFLLHPGGRKLLDHIESELHLRPEHTALSRGVLRDHGNMSSATILYVIDRFLRGPAAGMPAGAHGLLAAMGPGFSIDQLHLRWEA